MPITQLNDSDEPGCHPIPSKNHCTDRAIGIREEKETVRHALALIEGQAEQIRPTLVVNLRTVRTRARQTGAD